MEPLIAFFERLVTDFTWKRLVFLLTILAMGVIGLWVYEAFTGRFRANRMEFAVDHLKKLSDPELKRNVEGDPELEKAHAQLKGDLNRLLEQSQVDVGVPDILWKALSAAAPWLMLGILMSFFIEQHQRRQVAGGLMILATFCILVAIIVPTWSPRWLNYAALPIASFAVVLLIILVLDRARSVRMNRITARVPDVEQQAPPSDVRG